MAKYTTELRTICEHFAGNKEPDINKIIEKSLPYIFDTKAEYFDEDYKTIIQSKIIKHYFTKEICFETFGIWKFYFNTRMNELLPYYNALYKSALLEFNPFDDTDYSRSMERHLTGTQEDSNSDKSKIKNKVENETKSEYKEKGHNEYADHQSIHDVADTTDNTTTDNYIHANENVDNDVHNHTDSTVTDVIDKDDTTWNMHSDTPQGGLNGVRDETYLSDATHNIYTDDENNSHHTLGDDVTTNDTITDTNTTEHKTFGEIGNTTKDVTDNKNGTSDAKKKGKSEVTNKTDNNTYGYSKRKGNKLYNDTETWIESYVGKRNGKSYSELLKEYRDTFLNIDLMFIHEFADLFMTVW